MSSTHHAVSPTPVPPEQPALRVVQGDQEIPNTDDVATVISVRSFASSELADLRGKRLAHFEVGEPIGAGGMAAVFRATDVNLGRPVALKILPPDLARDPLHVQRFAQEAKAAALLDHPAIARVYHSGVDLGLHFIAFECVEGKTLRDLIDQSGRMLANDIVPIIAQIARGLAHASDRGVVHRDVKPSNIIVNGAGAAKLVDMGLARYASLDANALTQSGTTLGTLDYISPEQALDPRSVDSRSDVYSLGCTLYHALTGVPPVPEGTAAKKLHHHQYVSPADPRDSAPDLSPDLIAILGRAMAKRPGDRYQSPSEFAQDLEVFQTNRGPECPTPRLIAAKSESVGFGWIAAVAALAVFTLVALSEWAQSAKPNAGALLWAYSDASVAGGSPMTSANLPQHDAANVGELCNLLSLDEVSIRLTSDEYRLTSDEQRSLVFAGKRLHLTGADPTRPVRMVGAAGGNAKATLTTRCAPGSTVTLRDLCFENATGAEGSAVALLGAEQLQVERCVFRGLRSTAILAEPVGDKSPDRGSLNVSESAFIGCREAIRLAAGGRVEMYNVAALNCDCFIKFGSRADLKPFSARLENCTIRQAIGGVFLSDGNAGGIIEVGGTLFAGASAGGPTLIDQRSSGEIELRTLYMNDGSRLRNGYHAIPVFWRITARGSDLSCATPDDCLQRDLAFFDGDPLLLSSLDFQASDWPARYPADVRPWVTIRDKVPRGERVGVRSTPWGNCEAANSESGAVEPGRN